MTADGALTEALRQIRDAALDAAAQEYVDALAERDSLNPREAARAAGARTEEDITALAQRIATDRRLPDGAVPSPAE